MLIGNSFCNELKQKKLLDKVTSIKVDLYGSLSLTGRGHLSDVAIMLGLSGLVPKTTTTKHIQEIISSIEDNNKLNIMNEREIPFNRKKDIIFNPSFLDLHENGVIISAYERTKIILEKTYFSIGGGFITDKENFGNKNQAEENKLEIDFNSANELIELCNKHKKHIWEIALMRETQTQKIEEIEQYYTEIWEVMRCSINNGLEAKGVLPGGLGVQRRAALLHERLSNSQINQNKEDFYSIQWITAYALAVAEENAAGHRVVTAPTNGACAIVPAVMAYYEKFYTPNDSKWFIKFLLTASAIGYIYKTNASISGAEAGCQAEIGAASSMAAVALAELIGGNPFVCAMAGEIAMEHHLGLTCDPVGGLVQIPCIERNSFGAVKAIMAAKMALTRDGDPIVSLDDVIRTMYNTGKDMDKRYRETAEGGLAKIIKCELK
jgi:L-serine dehydratase